MSTLFKEYKKLNFKILTEDIRRYWEINKIFQKSISTRKSNHSYTFYEGPPSANGMPGIHHVMSRMIKDIICRYKTLKGKQVQRKAGWDTHGLPVELSVEKELGIVKEDIGKKISIEDYNKICKSSVMRYTSLWNKLTSLIGFWLDINNPYITYETKYMESIWWLIKQLYQKGLLYKGYKVQPYSPSAGTGLSSHELNLPGTYKDITDISITVQFKSKIETLPKKLQNISKNIYFLAWTTTPWTLPSNTALAVGANIEYAIIITYNQYTFFPICVILAKNLIYKHFLDKYFLVTDIQEYKNYQKFDKKIPYLIIDVFNGKEIFGCRYEQLLPWAFPSQNINNAFQVVLDDFVNIDEGTGIVHIAPTFGIEDSIIAKKYNIPSMLVLDNNNYYSPLVDLQGRFLKILPKNFAGRYIKNEYSKVKQINKSSIDIEIAILLKSENKVFKTEKYKHSYPHCWRTEKPILYYPLNAWFIKTTSIKKRMIELNNTIQWIPKSTGERRFGNWLENINDWNLSRSRYWGIPLPIWRTKEGDEEYVIGSIAELISKIEKSVEKGFMTTNPFKNFIIGNMSKENYEQIDLHKHILDKIVLVSSSGKFMKRESDLIDVWFDSGAMPYASLHYPFENQDYIDNKISFPADFIAEGVDQTRGWFYTLHAISCMLFDSVAFKNVISHGLVLDKFGHKMSKSKGNTINPFDVLEIYGPDATRWYMISNSLSWENLKFDLEGIEQVRRKFFNTLYNTYSFFVLYANIDKFQYKEKDIPIKDRDDIDRWILSELHILIQQVDHYYTNYNPTKSARVISDFVINNLSNWYVRFSRRRFWKGEYTKDKISAYQTLYICLLTVSKLASPIAPFFMDQLYQDLNMPVKKENFESVHLAYFPNYDYTIIDNKLGNCMEVTKQIISMVFSLRKKEKIKVRQPLQKLMILSTNNITDLHLENVFHWIKQETNIKEINFLDPKKFSKVLVKYIKPNYKILGPRLGKKIKKIAKIIDKFTQEDIENFEQKKVYKIFIDNEYVDILLNEVDIITKNIKDWSVSSINGLTIALDINLTDILKQEGLVRSLINYIQKLRKEKGFHVTDKIIIYINGPLILQKVIENNKFYICAETLASNLLLNYKIDNNIFFNIEGHKTMMFIEKSNVYEN